MAGRHSRLSQRGACSSDVGANCIRNTGRKNKHLKSNTKTAENWDKLINWFSAWGMFTVEQAPGRGMKTGEGMWKKWPEVVCWTLQVKALEVRGTYWRMEKQSSRWGVQGHREDRKKWRWTYNHQAVKDDGKTSRPHWLENNKPDSAYRQKINRRGNENRKTIHTFYPVIIFFLGI